MAHVGEVEPLIPDVFQPCEVRLKRWRDCSWARAGVGCTKIEIVSTPLRVQVHNVVELISLRGLFNKRGSPLLDERVRSSGDLALHVVGHFRSRSCPRGIHPHPRRPFVLSLPQFLSFSWKESIVLLFVSLKSRTSCPARLFGKPNWEGILSDSAKDFNRD